MTDYITRCPSPLGMLTMASDGESLTGLWIEGQKYGLSAVDGQKEEDLPVFIEAKDWLARYFAGSRPKPKELPLAPSGTAFRRQIWRYLVEIPYGTTTTYGELARRAAVDRGIPSMSAQAVGNAVGHNPISIIIPCHRVIGSDGSLTGYAGGLDKKQWLLRHEGV